MTDDSEERILEFITIHRPLGPVPPEVMKKWLELGKKFIAEPSKVIPGGKLIAAYVARAQSLIVCILEAPSIDALVPGLEQMNAMGWENEIIPAEKMKAFLPKFEKMLAQ